ncbi:hypothetical protein VTI28DRAFT_7789 [Corynascus sepedonium]
MFQGGRSAVGRRERGASAPRNHRLSAPRGGPTGRFSPERRPQPVGTPGGFEQVWRTAKHPHSPPLGAHGVFPCACRVFPDAARTTGRVAPVAAAVLRWCSPQSSVPRQTVGHHAKAAMYEMGPTAACEGCRGVVPSSL